MAYKLNHPTLRTVKGYIPTSYENVPVRDGIATAQRPVSVGQLEAKGWKLIDESKRSEIPGPKQNTVKKKADKKKKASKKV
ncbi:hypothetical protein LCGC14_1167060 [marine sediment metagenome]|uniref:Uncharacterized protein n=1 Tax=marine sediment metagenome TaxID=412755 RepID=A0A0F9LVT7_9ZZZZ